MCGTAKPFYKNIWRLLSLGIQIPQLQEPAHIQPPQAPLLQIIISKNVSSVFLWQHPSKHACSLLCHSCSLSSGMHRFCYCCRSYCAACKLPVFPQRLLDYWSLRSGYTKLLSLNNNWAMLNIYGCWRTQSQMEFFNEMSKKDFQLRGNGPVNTFS